MASTKEIFALRKQGKIEEAFNLADALFNIDPNDEWVIKAYAWTLYDKIKILVEQKEYTKAKQLGEKLEQLPIEESDKYLYPSVQRVLLSIDPNREILKRAKAKSEAGDHSEALKLYKEAQIYFQNDLALENAIAWELYRSSKDLFASVPIKLADIKIVLAEYIKLKNERPSRIHSLFLGIADKIIESDQFNVISFLKLWDLNKLTDEDFQPNEYNGKLYPSRGEKIIQHVSKLIIKKRLISEIDYFKPFLEIGIKKFPENIWLPYYKVKFLQLSGKNEEALNFITPIVKAKSNDFWTWALLAELYFDTEPEMSMSSFCRALMCPAEEGFLINTRIRLAELLLKKNMFSEAKYEIVRAIKTKTDQGLSLGAALTNYQNFEWFIKEQEIKSNNDFYKKKSRKAEEVLLKDLPWIEGCLGSTYVTQLKPDKPRRNIFIKAKSNAHDREEITKISVSERILKSLGKINNGDAVKLKGEKSKDGKYTVFCIERRTENAFDIFPKNSGNITGIRRNIKGDIEKVYITIKLGKYLFEEPYGDDAGAIKNFKVGQPVFVIGYYFSEMLLKDYKKQQEHRMKNQMPFKIVSVDLRPEGSDYDLIPEEDAIINYINVGKQTIHLISESKREIFFRKNEFDGELLMGTVLKVRTKELEGDKGKYLRTVTIRKAIESHNSSLKRSYEGTLEVYNGFGKVDGVFVSPDLIKSVDLKDGQSVYGTAIINFEKKKGIWGWKALDSFSIEKDIDEHKRKYGFYEIGEFYYDWSDIKFELDILNHNTEVSECEILKRINTNTGFLLRMISVHYPFSIDEIEKYAEILKWGTPMYSFHDHSEYDFFVGLEASYGLLFNNNINFTELNLDETKFEEIIFSIYVPTVFKNEEVFPMNSDKEISFKLWNLTNPAEMVNMEYRPEFVEEFSEMYREYERKHKNLIDFNTLEFNINTLDDLEKAIRLHKIFTLNTNLYTAIFSYLSKNNIEVIKVLDSLKSSK